MVCDVDCGGRAEVGGQTKGTVEVENDRVYKEDAGCRDGQEA